MKKLAIEMVRYEAKLDPDNFDGVVIVDSQLFQLPGRLADLPVISIVDHHKLQIETEAEFLDVREDCGSTCSIYAEYFTDGLATMDRENPACAKLASALLYGYPQRYGRLSYSQRNRLPERHRILHPTLTTNCLWPSPCRAFHRERWKSPNAALQIK